MTSENIAVDNEKCNLVGEINDQDVQDVTQNSLTKKTKSLRKTHMSTQVNILQNESTLLDYRNNASTPNTLKRTRNVSTDAAPVTAAFNEGTSSLLHRHAYLHIAETEKENRKLKTEVSDLKLQYLTMKTELDNEKVRRVEIEQIWRSQKKILDEERWKFENERNDWEKERKKLLMDRDELAAELKKLHQHDERHGEHDNDSESQDDNSWNIISLTSGEESEFKNCYLITYHPEQ
ncbi:unnamed protein product [Onchocerca ochengi]|uniref:BMERB domain-containing protein n=1 Tax=Onchocerca ochengi TaxID=42157 RepID=A0A182ESW1_ONCOC|nr:unnamed protein product [Onchocerca ochengi]